MTFWLLFIPPYLPPTTLSSLNTAPPAYIHAVKSVHVYCYTRVHDGHQHSPAALTSATAVERIACPNPYEVQRTVVQRIHVYNINTAHLAPIISTCFILSNHNLVIIWSQVQQNRLRRIPKYAPMREFLI